MDYINNPRPTQAVEDKATLFLNTPLNKNATREELEAARRALPKETMHLTQSRKVLEKAQASVCSEYIRIKEITRDTRFRLHPLVNRNLGCMFTSNKPARAEKDGGSRPTILLTEKRPDCVNHTGQ